jgi:hypothetical protein
MKRIACAALAALLGVAVVTPSAHAIGVMASWWSMDDEDQDGFGGGIRSKTQIVPLVAIDTRLSWINFSDGDLNVFPIEATGLLKLGMLYAGLGGGYYVFDADYDVDNAFGWYLVGGIELGVGKFGLFGEFKYTMLSADITGPFPDDVNSATLEADGIGVNVGVMFGIPMM